MLASQPPVPVGAVSERNAPTSESPAERRYVEITGKLTRVTGGGAFVISTLVTMSTLPDQRLFMILLAIQCLQIPFNVWVNLHLLKRVGVVRGELIRNSANIVTSMITGHIANWPLPAWLWLPFIALVFDHMNPRLATLTLAATTLATTVLATYDGVHWIYPVSFTAFAIFCAQISRLRFEEISDMLLRGDAQRRELERAHAAVIEAHEQLTRESKARELAEIELRQAQKLEAIGRLAAGVAHEINTPVQFASDNLRFSRESLTDLLGLIQDYRGIVANVHQGTPSSAAVAIANEAEEKRDLSFLAAEMPGALERSLEGVERIAAIVRSIKEFAQPDQKELVAIDLNGALTNVVEIAGSEYKHCATLECEFAPLPPIVCRAGDINQVLLNLIVNAAQAIAEAPKGAEGKGHIKVRTALDAERKSVVVSVEDDGPGIPEAVQRRIFEPFFTTKAVGKGVGQGLAVSRAVVQRHGGTLTFETREGVGTTFRMRLPIEAPVQEAEAS